MVVHLLLDPEGDQTPQVGLVVSKAVGNAVHRNLVKRRLRAVVRALVPDLPDRSRTVVRALPASSTATYADLRRDVAGALRKAVSRAVERGAALPGEA